MSSSDDVINDYPHSLIVLQIIYKDPGHSISMIINSDMHLLEFIEGVGAKYTMEGFKPHLNYLLRTWRGPNACTGWHWQSGTSSKGGVAFVGARQRAMQS